MRIYTRALNEVTQAMPEIVELARALAPAELILDGEAIALDANDRPHPFQITMRRFGRKLDVEAAARGDRAARILLRLSAPGSAYPRRLPDA